MDAIVVNKVKLIEIMEANRAQHHKIVVEAQAGFREKVIARLDEMLKLAADGKKIDINVGLAMPQDFTKEYDKIIGMLKLDINETVELEQSEYQMWVQDEWGWSRSFTSSNSAYSMTAAHM